MAVLASLSSPNDDRAPDSAPRRLVTAFDGIEAEVIRFERQGSIAVPYVVVSGVPAPELEDVLDREPQFRDYQRLERADDGILYRFSWEVDAPIIYCMTETNGTILHARGVSREWQLEVWFDDRTDASTFQQCCRDQDIPLSVDRLASLAEYLSRTRAEVSDPQREALVLAHREGYFDTPRRVTQEDLAAALDISSSAVSTRLRRGIDALIEATLVE